MGRMTSPEVAALGRTGALLVVPVGSTEQHGPHLPLGTDTMIAVELSTRLAARRGDVVVAPALSYGSSGEHDGFAGTLSIGQQALELLVVELGRSASASFAAMLLVSAHGGNQQPLRRAVALLTGEGRTVSCWSPSFRGDAHAGRTETSLALAIAPGAVRLELAEPGSTRPVAELMGVLRSAGVAQVSANGVLGDPAGASAEEGERLLGAAVLELADHVARWPALRARLSR